MAKVHLQNGLDWNGRPVAEERAASLPSGKRTSVKWAALAEQVLAMKEQAGRSPLTLKRDRYVLNLTLPALAEKPVNSITRQDFLAICREEERKGNLIASRRILGLSRQVIKLALA
ncbi:MAG: hypothetical protein KI785_03270 [Devosiaceae bacterium]|nr:hypothetical protein [Devosiaceae bacterium MH13]